MSFACAELPAATLTHFRVDVAETLCSISSCLRSDDTPDLQDHQHISESQVSISCIMQVGVHVFQYFQSWTTAAQLRRDLVAAPTVSSLSQL